MNTCDICLKVFKRRDNMLRHKKKTHTTSDIDSDRSDHDDVETTSLESDTEEEVHEGKDDVTSKHIWKENNDPWESVIQNAFSKCRDQYQEEVDKLLKKRTLSQRDARKRVYEDMQSTFRKAVLSIFTSRMMWFQNMKKEPVYKAVKRTATNLIDLDDFDSTEAWKSAISQRRYLFDKILEAFEPPELSSPSEAEEVDEERSEKEEESDEDMEIIEPSVKRIAFF